MIELKGVSYKYKSSPDKEILALDNINLRIEPGEYVAILGHNGSGKTTLARLLNSLLVPESGEVLIDGLNSTDRNAGRSILLKVGMVFQNPDNQLISTTVEREIAFGLENLAVPYEEMKQKVKKALEEFDLIGYRLYPPHKLSGGEKQRVALASVLAMEPDYLILDEPTSLLDSKGKREFLGLIGKLPQKGKAVIHITQFPEESILARRLLVMCGGKIVMDGYPFDILRRVEELEKMGLDVPFDYKMAHLLSKKKLSEESGTFSIKQIAEEIARRVSNPKIKEGRKAGTENIIKVENLSFSFPQSTSDHRKALDDVNLEINSGDLVGLIGPTGSGKSTLVQHLNGLLRPSQGKVFYRNQDINSKNVDLRKIRQKVGLAFQFPELQIFEERVFDDIAFGPKNLGLDKDEIEKRVRDSMESLGLDFEGFAFRSPFSLSGGEQRKVALAGILALNPEVLILDEPTVGLDPQSTRNLKSIIKSINHRGMTIILVSHNLDLIAQIATKVVLLNEGRLIKYCSKQEFFEDTDMLGKFDLDVPPMVRLISQLRNKKVVITEGFFDLEELVASMPKDITGNR